MSALALNKSHVGVAEPVTEYPCLPLTYMALVTKEGKEVPITQKMVDDICELDGNDNYFSPRILGSVDIS